MKYEDIPAVKNKMQYDVPKDYFDANFEKFVKNYNGYYRNRNITIKAPAWRAFEIEYRRYNTKLFEKSDAIKQETVADDTTERENPRRRRSRNDETQIENSENE